MTNIETQLKQLRLMGMSDRWDAFIETREQHQLSLSEGLEMLLQSEQEDRSNRRFERLKRTAKFRYSATIEEIGFTPVRGLNKSQISELATGQYLVKGESVLITGATGCGKSFIASALGHRACAQGSKVLYFNAQKLLAQTKMARIDGSIFKLFGRIAVLTPIKQECCFEFQQINYAVNLFIKIKCLSWFHFSIGVMRPNRPCSLVLL